MIELCDLIDALRAERASAQQAQRTAEQQRDEWRDALDGLHVTNWIGVIDGLSPREAVAKLLEYALDIERDELKTALAHMTQERDELKAELTALKANLADRPIE